MGESHLNAVDPLPSLMEPLPHPTATRAPHFRVRKRKLRVGEDSSALGIEAMRIEVVISGLMQGCCPQ